jgi:tRNA (guanine37-N1)-methyltransferase
VRVDVVSIFPEYLAPLQLSLLGKAQRSGVLEVTVHDLRTWAHDRHRTVDDTPAGGGAGMVMKPEPWGEALDAVAPDGATLLVPTPAGEPLTQALAVELATRGHLVVACGRYEGIDQRVVEDAGRRLEVREVSLGDYVLNGGEVAALVVLEAVCRLLPGFMGNAESLAEESHDGGLLEAPVYTKPASWRGLDVPEVLLSGDHARIARWRHEASLLRTAARRPDLLHPSQAVQVDQLDGALRLARPADAGELLTLQLACWVAEQQHNPEVHIPPLHESLEDVQEWLGEWTTLVLRHPAPAGRLIGAVRGRVADGEWEIGRLMAAPDLQGRGLGRLLLSAIEQAAPDEVRGFRLVTGHASARNQRIYTRAGYRLRRDLPAPPGAVVLTKRPRTPRS